MKTVTDVLIDHQRQSSSACLCGWSKLGHSHPAHQAEALTAAGYGPHAEANVKVQQLAQRLLDEDIVDSLEILDRLASGDLKLIGGAR